VLLGNGEVCVCVTSVLDGKEYGCFLNEYKHIFWEISYEEKEDEDLVRSGRYLLFVSAMRLV